MPVTGSLERSLGASTPIINAVIYTSNIAPRDSFQHFVSEKSTIFKSVCINGRFFFILARFFNISKSIINNIISVPALYDTVRFEILTYRTKKIKSS